MIYNVTNVPELISASNNAIGGDTIRIQAGTYKLDSPLVFDKFYTQDEPLRIVALEGSKFYVEGKPRTLDLKGEHIIWSGGEFWGGTNNVVELRGDNIIFSFAEVHGGFGTTKTNSGIGLIGFNNTIYGCKIHDFGNIGIDGNAGKRGDNYQILQGRYESSQNWHIYDNEIYNISYNVFGFHEGAMKIVPWARDVYVYSNHVHDCQGQGIWFDRPEGNIIIYGNLVERVEGKSIFYEISDDTTSNIPLTCDIVYNTIRSGEKHGIFVSASSHVNVYGNVVEAWLPIVVHGMPREIDKQGGVPGTGNMWKLEDNYVHHNVLKNTYHRSHLAVYDYESNTDSNANRNTFDNNYYVVGHQVIFNGKTWDITQPTFALGISKGLNHVTHEGISNDPNGLVGSMPNGLPWSDQEIGISNLKLQYDFLKSWSNPIIVDPKPNPPTLSLGVISETSIQVLWNNPDTVKSLYTIYLNGVSVGTSLGNSFIINGLVENTSYNIEVDITISGETSDKALVIGKTTESSIGVDPVDPVGLPDIIVFTDYSEDTDPDDMVSMSALLLTAPDNINIKRIVVGCHQVGYDQNKTYKYVSPLDMYNKTHGLAFSQEKDNLGYNYAPQIRLADTHRLKIKRDSPNAGDNIKEIVELLKSYSPDNPIYFLNWGILTELAVLVEYIINDPNLKHLIDHFVIISHFTHNTSANNYFKDAEAAFYLKNLAGSNMLKFIELGPFGAELMDDRNAATGELSPDVMLSKIGKYFKEKWIEHSVSQPGRPDCSDFSSVWALYDRFGFGKNFLERVKTNGQNNFDVCKTLWNQMAMPDLSPKEVMYKYIEDQAKKARSGIVIDNPVIDNPECPDCDSCCPDCSTNDITDPRIIKLMNDFKVVVQGMRDLGLI